MIRGAHSSLSQRALVVCGRRAVSVALVGSLLATALPSRAQAPDASCDAVEQTETMRNEGQYRKARARLLECVNAQCGGDVRRRCATTLQKLDASTPSIVVRAEDGEHNDVLDVAVTLEGEPLMSSLDGMAIPVDPGEHQFVFSRPGHPPVNQTLTIERGQKFRAIDVVIGEEPKLEPTPAESRQPSASGPSERALASATLIGVGVVGLASFTWLGLRARSGEDDLKECEPTCSRGNVDSVEARYVLANVSLGVGVLALGAATWVLLSGPSSKNVAEPVDEGFAVGADGHGAFAAYSGRF